jgi:hypothetical protein
MGKNLEKSRKSEARPMKVGLADALIEERGEEFKLQRLAPTLVQDLDFQEFAMLDVALVEQRRLERCGQGVTT